MVVVVDILIAPEKYQKLSTLRCSGIIRAMTLNMVVELNEEVICALIINFFSIIHHIQGHLYL